VGRGASPLTWDAVAKRQRRWCSTTTGGGGKRGGGGGGGKKQPDGLRLNHASRFGQVRAALSDSHTPMLYYQIEHKVRALRRYINIRGAIPYPPTLYE